MPSSPDRPEGVAARSSSSSLDEMDTNNNVDAADNSESPTIRRSRPLERRILKRRANSSSPGSSTEFHLKHRRARSLAREVENKNRKRSLPSAEQEPEPLPDDGPVQKRRHQLLQSPSLESLSLEDSADPATASRNYDFNSRRYPFSIANDMRIRRHHSLPECGSPLPEQNGKDRADSVCVEEAEKPCLETMTGDGMEVGSDDHSDPQSSESNSADHPGKNCA